jgi:hypothetical protein
MRRESRLEEITNAHITSIERPQGKSPHGKPNYRWQKTTGDIIEKV